ncbi:hypothetical protein [Candidatus Manganitrophus noduliformans]|uniref:Uncharacterized protein n=1 Tax=Candidatus Manganitrophus noduliformans TaxID=2606439 RepID=A0A7X6DSE5_9BACT|nr:hypothetical protein [Candidatus Manganitrophus noduliformans]NKE72537.1 hypothetical protein [Candidatus Manganitrophus noduliformans]
MLSGINTDIQFKGEVYHVQTEDGGTNNPIITTLLFKGGAIFSSKKTNYAEILQSPSYQEVVKELMKEQHKSMVRDLTAGKFQTPARKEFRDDRTAPDVKAPSPAPVPPQKVSQKKSLDDLILDYLSEKEKDAD